MSRKSLIFRMTGASDGQICVQRRAQHTRRGSHLHPHTPLQPHPNPHGSSLAPLTVRALITTTALQRQTECRCAIATRTARAWAGYVPCLPALRSSASCCEHPATPKREGEDSDIMPFSVACLDHPTDVLRHKHEHSRQDLTQTTHKPKAHPKHGRWRATMPTPVATRHCMGRHTVKRPQ